MPKTVGLILADEEDASFPSSVPKYQMSLNGTRVLDYSLKALSPYCDDLIVIDQAFGHTRLDRIQKALSILSAGCTPDLLLIHDSSYPFVMQSTIRSILSALTHGYPYAISTVPIDEALLLNNRHITAEQYQIAQYPEGICFTSLREASKWAEATGKSFTHVADLLWAWRRIMPITIPGLHLNARISSPRDLAVLEGAFKFTDECTEQEDKDLSQSRVLILGGTGGIGTACLDLLHKKGAYWHAPTRKELDLNARNSFSELTSFNAVINAAGAYIDHPDTIMKVNFLSCIDLLLAAEAMQWTGNIVFLSSTAATEGRRGIATYSASKAALNSYIEAEAERLSAKGIFINAIAPAKVDTRLQRAINPSAASGEMISPGYIARLVLRYVSTNEFGKIVYVRKGLDT